MPFWLDTDAPKEPWMGYIWAQSGKINVIEQCVCSSIVHCCYHYCRNVFDSPTDYWWKRMLCIVFNGSTLSMKKVYNYVDFCRHSIFPSAITWCVTFDDILCIMLSPDAGYGKLNLIMWFLYQIASCSLPLVILSRITSAVMGLLACRFYALLSCKLRPEFE